MKKKLMIIPCILLAVSIVASVFLTVFASPFIANADAGSYYYADEVNREKMIEQTEKKIKYSEIAYRISPNESTLYPLIELYSPNRLFMVYGEFPEKYRKKSVEYTKAELDYALKGEKNLGMGPHAYLNINTVWYVFSQETYIVESRCNYAVALFADHQRDEALRQLDEAIAFYETNGAEDTTAMVFRIPFGYLYALCESDADKQAVIDRELEVTNWTKANRNLSEEYAERENLFVNKTMQELRDKGWEE